MKLIFTLIILTNLVFNTITLVSQVWNDTISYSPALQHPIHIPGTDSVLVFSEYELHILNLHTEIEEPFLPLSHFEFKGCMLTDSVCVLLGDSLRLINVYTKELISTLSFPFQSRDWNEKVYYTLYRKSNNEVIITEDVQGKLETNCFNFISRTVTNIDFKQLRNNVMLVNGAAYFGFNMSKQKHEWRDILSDTLIATAKTIYNYPHKLSDSLIYDIDNDTIKFIGIYQDTVFYQLINSELSKNQNYQPYVFISLDKRMIWISTITKDRHISTVSVISTKTWKKIGEYQTETLNLTISYYPEYLPTFLMPKDESTFWISEHFVHPDIKDPVCPVIDMSIISSFTIHNSNNGIYKGKFPYNTFFNINCASYSLNGSKLALNISYQSQNSNRVISNNIYDTKTGNLLKSDLSPARYNYYSSILSFTGDTLFTNTDSVLYALSTKDGSELYNVKLQIDKYRNLSKDEMQISSDGKYIGIVTNKLLYILQSYDGSLYRTIPNTDTNCYSLRAFHFEHGTNDVIMVNYLGTITVNNIITGTQTNICSTPRSVNLGYPISWSAKGDKMLVGRYLINTYTGNVIYSFPDFKNPPFCNSNCLTTDGTYCIVEYEESNFTYASGWKNSITDSLFCSGLNARILARSYDSKQILYLKESNGYTYGSNMTYILSNTTLCPEIIMDVNDTPKGHCTIENSIAITPNPITSYSTITFNQETESPVELLIYDTRGLSTSVYYNPKESVGTYHIEIDMRSFANGAYYLVYKSNINTTSGIFIKMDE